MGNFCFNKWQTGFGLLAILLVAWLLWPGSTPSVTKVVKSPYTYQKTIHNIKTAIASNNFKIVRQNTRPNVHTLYFCNFDMAHKAILKDKRAGVLLPCKIKIIKSHNKVYVVTSNIDVLSKQTGIRIGSLCRSIKASIDTIMDEATI